MASISGGNTYGSYQGNVNMVPTGQKSLIAPPTTASPSTTSTPTTSMDIHGMGNVGDSNFTGRRSPVGTVTQQP